MITLQELTFRMKKIISLITIFALVTLTSCINIIEEIFLKKDGSGKYTVTLDLSSIISMKDMLLSESKMSKRDSLKLVGEKYDSTIYFNTMSDSTRSKFRYPELIERAYVTLKVDEPAGIMNVTLVSPFTEIEEINKMMEDINNHKKDSTLRKFDIGIFGYRATYKVTRKSIERRTMFSEPNEKDSLKALMNTAFMSNARIKTIYHLPGKVKSTTISDAYLRGNDCMIELTYPEFVTGKKSMDGKIIFK
jgi:hypothetical protein